MDVVYALFGTWLELLPVQKNEFIHCATAHVSYVLLSIFDTCRMRGHKLRTVSELSVYVGVAKCQASV